MNPKNLRISYFILAVIFCNRNCNADVIYYSNENKMEVTLELVNIPDDVWNYLITVLPKNENRATTIKSILVSDNTKVVYSQEVSRCMDGYRYNVILQYKTGKVCDFRQIFLMDYTPGTTNGTLQRYYWLDWENKCNGNVKRHADVIVGENFLQDCILKSNEQNVVFYHNVNYYTPSDITSMQIQKEYSLRYKSVVYGFDNDTTIACENVVCTNNCVAQRQNNVLLVRPFKGVSEVPQSYTNKENVFFEIGQSYIFNCPGVLFIHTDANHRILNLFKGKLNLPNFNANFTLTQDDANTILYCLSYSCIINNEMKYYECTRYVLKEIKFYPYNKITTTTEDPESNIEIEVDIKDDIFRFKSHSVYDGERSFHLAQNLNYGNHTEILSYPITKYPMKLYTVLTAFDNNTRLNYMVIDPKTSSCLLKKYNIVVTQENVTKEIDIEKIYYIEHKELQLDCIDSYWIKVNENNAVISVINSSTVNNTIKLDRWDNNSVIFCVTITCTIYKMRSNRCLRDVKQMMFILEELHVNKTYTGVVITGCVIGFAVLSIILRIAYKRIQKHKIKERNKLRPPLPTPVPREPVPYHHYEVIDPRFS